MNTAIDPERFARRRVAAGLSQTDLAAILGVTKQHVSMVATGQANFSPRLLKATSEALDCEIEDLLAEEPADTPRLSPASAGSPA
ncbi:helix-turn-helix transcriptional regulator [Streptomyces sp. NPDC007903]|uniref:helix-turn-helix transcriptional regulator n=1 Tax=Streptomyces sp. NPDC007903 TaxID=3364786 RepID=UPI0036E060AA